MKKQISIPEELFLSLTKLVLLEVSDPELLAHCQQGIREKIELLIRKEGRFWVLYTKTLAFKPFLRVFPSFSYWNDIPVLLECHSSATGMTFQYNHFQNQVILDCIIN